MRVGVIQSCYIPWRGFFDFIRSVDLFLLFDDVKYPMGRSWRNRNQVKTRNGLKWLSVPVPKGSHELLIDEVRISETGKPWREAHANALQESLDGAPHAEDAHAIWTQAVNAGDTGLSELNARLIKGICAYLSISTPILPSRQFGAQGAATDRLINLVKAVGGSTYVSGPVAKSYLEEWKFRQEGLRLEYKRYDYAPYPQLWGAFEGAVTVLDLIANTGPDATNHIASLTPNEIAVG